MSLIENMPEILRLCRRDDPDVLFIVGRPKNGNVICYKLENETIVPYWRLENGEKMETSYFEKLVLAVEKSDGQFYIVGLPEIRFTLTASGVHHSDKTIAFVFLGEPKRFFSPSPLYIIIKYTDGSTQKINF